MEMYTVPLQNNLSQQRVFSLILFEKTVSKYGKLPPLLLKFHPNELFSHSYLSLFSPIIYKTKGKIP